MKELITKVDSFLLKSLSGNGAGTSIATFLVLGLGAVILSVYMGWIKIKGKRRGW
ncbi:hypothetical protein Q785_00315 [Ornithobacterium rhinotracheale ORT-UMN 88]|uniref:hypothetical protein n=1 Tax=Ornithobacterium rhinotracheale TaxID=28251 RepID=UPI0004F5F2D8|nr:hypothetical protein [Ornithobacterium rhinotracheale]AIP98523.1 hypothetical protein Q785_00315 [Ornithobacterium rhinotracheale ORT-UMN 88]UVD87333.1 hypothetical protein NV236_00285 [Ornithobacterium rhinotracheale]